MRKLSYTDAAGDDIYAIAEYIALSAQSIGVGEGFTAGRNALFRPPSVDDAPTYPRSSERQRFSLS